MHSRSEIGLPRAYYYARADEFLASDDDMILGTLIKHSDMSVEPSQRDAWQEEITILKRSLRGIDGMLALEFNIPRMGKRIDAVVIVQALIAVIEFKIGEERFTRADINQVWDYALDLKNFHEASHEVVIIPMLVASAAQSGSRALSERHEDGVYVPVTTNSAGVRAILEAGVSAAHGEKIDGDEWYRAPYHPTPTIIEAAQALYAQHAVEAIARHDAGARNLSVTTQRIEEVIEEARLTKSKSVCLITGVPGAGKTLVGLNIATRRREREHQTHAVFLSGNGPLVAVLREALTRDEMRRQRAHGTRERKGVIRERVKAFIQNVHHFRDEALRHSAPPIDHVVIFDEAQRAWNREQTTAFMHRKKKIKSFAQSEPEFLLSYLDRHEDWAVVVCLVGGGQEINTGEAGIAAWIEAINTQFSAWHLYISPELHDREYAAGQALEMVRTRPQTHYERDLHLAVSLRSFRAEHVATFVKAVLDCEIHTARTVYATLRQKYPIALTRDLRMAKEWLHSHARGSERYGMVASSEAQRLKPHAIDVRVNIDPVHWFLDDGHDTRSSLYLEDAASQFDVQGLELDWACVTWDADLRVGASGWQYHTFRGYQWCQVHKADRRNYLLNAYRVLLTRARQGMIIFVPPGDTTDATRQRSYYDGTFDYLASIGLPIIC